MQVDVPAIELVDLPGIQLYPTDLYVETTKLVNSHLQEALKRTLLSSVLWMQLSLAWIVASQRRWSETVPSFPAPSWL